MKEIIIIGAGGHGRVCAEAAQAAGFQVSTFWDAAPDDSASINGIEVLKVESVADAAETIDRADIGVFVAIGDNDTRMEYFAEVEKIGFTLPAIIHPSAIVSPSAEIGPGTVIVANSVVNANACVGKGCILNTACTIDHDNILGDGVQISPGVHSAGTVRFGEKAFVGTGAIITPGVTIGREAHIAAGALVISDVADGERVGRFPSRPERP